MKPPIIQPGARMQAREAAAEARRQDEERTRLAALDDRARAKTVQDARDRWERERTEENWQAFEAGVDAFRAHAQLRPCHPRRGARGVVMTLGDAPPCACVETPRGFVCVRDRLAPTRLFLSVHVNCRADES